MKRLAVAATAVVLAACTSSDLAIVPIPKEIEQVGASMAAPEVLRCSLSSPELRPLVSVLDGEYRMLRGGSVIEEKGPGAPCRLAIDTTLDPDEYRLDSSRDIEVRGGSYRAVAMGTVSLLQAMGEGRLPRIRIADRPDTAYRGLLVDVARKPHGLEVLKQLVMLARWYKINHLQLHLTDDQLFAFPTASYPQLPTEGAHLTKAELRALDEFARERGVTLVPEIEMPGHAGQFIARMPEVFAIRDAGKNRGTMNMGREEVYQVLDEIIGEVAEVFATTPYVHIGGDEASLDGLADDPDVQRYLAAHGLADVRELYRHFLVRMNEIVRNHGKQTIVWEGFHSDGAVDIPRNILVMAWETIYQLPQDLIAGGYTIVNASWKPLYVVNRKKWDPREIYHWNLYRWENWVPRMPSYTPIQLDPSPAVIGGSMSSWDQPEHVEVHSLRRRLAAMSERLWTATLTPRVAWPAFATALDRTDASFGALLSPVEIDARGLRYPHVHDGNLNEHRWFGDTLEVRLGAPRGLSVHYTLDGSEPAPDSPRYRTPLVLTDSASLRARAFRADEPVGFVVRRDYELRPIDAQIEGSFAVPPERSWEPVGGAVEFYDEVTIELRAARAGMIHYTLDGTEPTPQSGEYREPIRLTESGVVTAQLFDSAGRPVGHRWSERLKLVPRLR